jgi:hypothetical protein
MYPSDARLTIPFQEWESYSLYIVESYDEFFVLNNPLKVRGLDSARVSGYGIPYASIHHDEQRPRRALPRARRG